MTRTIDELFYEMDIAHQQSRQWECSEPEFYMLFMAGNKKFSRTIFTGSIDLRGFNLSNIAFMYCILDNVSFLNANLKNTTFYGCEGTNTNFKGANMSSAVIKRCRFIDVDLSKASFSNSVIDNVQFSPIKTPAKNADFSEADLTNVEFDAPTISGFTFSYAELRNVNFKNSGLELIDFTGAKMSTVHMELCRDIVDCDFGSVSSIGAFELFFINPKSYSYFMANNTVPANLYHSNGEFSDYKDFE